MNFEIVKSKEIAEEIKNYRLNGCTWRKVAEKVADAHPDLGIDSGNQVDGMWLCKEAMLFLGEKYEDGWNSPI
jgi:hypothetical protein